jgi:hypothetical protein
MPYIAAIGRIKLPWKLQQGLRSLGSFFDIISQYISLFFPYLKHSFTNLLKNNRKNVPTIVVCLKEKDILQAKGTRLFQILNALAMSGYNINLVRKIGLTEYLYLGGHGRLVYSIENLKIVNRIPRETEDKIFCFDEDDKISAGRKWKKTIQIRYDIFSAPKEGEKPIVMPFQMHPLNYAKFKYHEKLKTFSENKRCFRIFFSGDMDKRYYLSGLFKYFPDKLSRLQAIEAVLTDLREESIYIGDIKDLDGLFTKQYTNKCVIIDTSKMYIQHEHWLDAISRSDFFLCVPGATIPMCYNAIEAMAVGTIPVINYPEWFKPHLKDMENCVIYTDKEDLIKKIKYILEMDQEKINQMRGNVIRYYEEHLDLKRFMNKLLSTQEDKTTVFVITTINKYFQNINSDSLIFS